MAHPARLQRGIQSALILSSKGLGWQASGQGKRMKFILVERRAKRPEAVGVYGPGEGKGLQAEP